MESQELLGLSILHMATALAPEWLCQKPLLLTFCLHVILRGASPSSPRMTKFPSPSTFILVNLPLAVHWPDLQVSGM